MKKKPRAPTRSQSTRFRKEARDFARWLDSPGKPQDLFRPLVELTAAATEHELRRKRIPDSLAPSDPHHSYKKKIDGLLERIEEQYLSQLRLADWRSRDGVLLFARQPLHQTGLEALEATEACLMLGVFERLASAGAFAALKLCALQSCGKHFFAFRLNRRYCSDACQRMHYSKSPERKKQNREHSFAFYHRLFPNAKTKKRRRHRSRDTRRDS